MYEMEGLTRSGCATSPIARIRVRYLTTAGLVQLLIARLPGL